MNRFILFLASLLFLLTTIVSAAWSRWNIQLDPLSNLPVMRYSEEILVSRVPIAHEITIELDNAFRPAQTKMKINTSFERALSNGEVTHYLKNRDGAQALWRYLAKQNKVRSVQPKNEEIPKSWNGQQAAIVVQGEKWFVGRLLTGLYDNAQWVALVIGDETSKPVNFYLPIIEKIYQLH